MPQAARARLQLSLGNRAVLGEEHPARGSVRIFSATAPTGTAARVYLHPPHGGGVGSWHDRIRQLGELRHPSLLPPDATGTTEDGIWVLEPLGAGPTAHERLQAHGALSVADAVRHLREIARGLVAMHRRGVAHGALGVDTVHMSPDATVVSGMGAALASEPEQDLRAFGRLAWTILTGAEPAGAPRPISRVRAGIPTDVASALDRLLAPETAPRTLRAEAVLEAFDAYPTPHESPLAGLLDRAGRGARDRRNRAVMIGVAVVGLAVLVGFLLLQRR